jgi:hypothetical protein
MILSWKKKEAIGVRSPGSRNPYEKPEVYKNRKKFFVRNLKWE